MKQNSKRLTSVILAALFLAASVVIYLVMIVPAYATLQTDKGQALSEQNLYNNESSTVNQVQALLTAYQNEASTTQSVNMALPVGQNVADALAQIYGIAANAGFTLESTGVTTQAVQAASSNSVSTNIGSAAAAGGSIVRPTGTVSFQIQGTGSYESLKSFLMGLESNIRIFDVTSISIQPATSVSSKSSLASTDFFNYTITVVTYYQSS